MRHTFIDISLFLFISWESEVHVILYRESSSVVGGIIAMVVFPFSVDSFSAQSGTLRGWTWPGAVAAVIN